MAKSRAGPAPPRSRWTSRMVCWRPPSQGRLARTTGVRVKRRPAVLYISYDGILEPLGQSQVLHYLRHLALDYRIVLLSYEKAEDWRYESRRSAILSIVREAGIEWVPLRYHKRPTA